jgi:RNA polymerase sigma-70 factor (ECF subfamily)
LSPPTPDIEELYRLHAPAAFRRARRMLGDEADAHEVVQDVFVALLAQPQQYARRSSLSTYFYSAVTNACLNRIRSRRTRTRLAERAVLRPASAEALDAEQCVVLHSALRTLPDLLAQVAIYHYIDDLTHDEIAQIIGCSRRHVGKLLAQLARHSAHRELSACS